LWQLPGHLDAKCDRGVIGDYVKVIRLMLQQDESNDYVIIIGEMHTVHGWCCKTRVKTQNCG